VTGTAGTARVKSTSLQTAKVKKATTKVKASVLGTVKGGTVRIRIRLSATGVKPRGTVVVRVAGKRVARIETRGTSTARVPIGRGARHKVTVTYLGSQQAARGRTTLVVRR
jgi:alpha-L-rhamnosidase